MHGEIGEIRLILKSGNQDVLVLKIIWDLFKQHPWRDFIDVMKEFQNEELNMIMRILVKNEVYEPSKAIEQLLHSRGITKRVVVDENQELKK